jgi:hypothetical protein
MLQAYALSSTQSYALVVTGTFEVYNRSDDLRNSAPIPGLVLHPAGASLKGSLQSGASSLASSSYAILAALATLVVAIY